MLIVKETVLATYQDICNGMRPWIAIGNFLDRWFVGTVVERQMLISESLCIPESATIEQRQWAVFLVAMIEWLCEREHMEVPGWVQADGGVVESPWFHGPNSDNPIVRDTIAHQTPPQFAKRNIFCRARSFNGKYQYTELTSRMAITR